MPAVKFEGQNTLRNPSSGHALFPFAQQTLRLKFADVPSAIDIKNIEGLWDGSMVLMQDVYS